MNEKKLQNVVIIGGNGVIGRNYFYELWKKLEEETEFFKLCKIGEINMDSGGHEIPVVEDDMGEGMMDPIDENETVIERRIRRDEIRKRNRSIFKEKGKRI